MVYGLGASTEGCAAGTGHLRVTAALSQGLLVRRTRIPLPSRRLTLQLTTCLRGAPTSRPMTRLFRPPPA